MNIELTEKEFRRLLDMVYIGDWILNSARGADRFQDYDMVQSHLFSLCDGVGMSALCEHFAGLTVPSQAFREGGIHEAIADYEDAVFFDILAEELARRDMEREGHDPDDTDDLSRRMEEYFQEFDEHGIDNMTLGGEE